ncbi:hypothetical protein BH23GEM6_BH23GEM6_15670 [soil metagenome]
MTHVDEGALLALLDGELDSDTQKRLNDHLAGCAACRREMDQHRAAAAVFSAALTESDSPAPLVGDTGVQAVRRRGRAQVAPRRFRDLGRAAVIVFGFAAAASATIPGTPVNDWLRELAGAQPAPVAISTRDDKPIATRELDEFTPESGVSVLPVNGEVHVVLRGATSDLRVRAVLVELPRAGVYTAGPAAEARFSTAPGRIEVTGAGGGEMRIELPYSARAATVEVNGRRYLAKDGDQLRLTVPEEDRAGAEVTFRVLR